MTFSRMIRSLVLGAIVLVLPATVSAQVVSGQTLTGDWVRTDSNNDPNDLMRIVVGATGAVLTAVPSSAGQGWKVGDVLWRTIQASGSLQVRGSDGNYYPATMKLNGPDEIRLTVHYRSSTAGDDQTWHRAGPDITGDWVLVGPVGVSGDGTRVQVQATDASVRYLPATAPRVLRVGSRIWQSIGASGGLQVLGNDGQHHAATWSLLAPDRIQVDAPGIAGGAGQIWVRPGSAQAARATLAAGPAAPAACFATALPRDRMGINWGLGMYSGSNDAARAEAVGIREFMASGPQSAWTGRNVPADLEHSRFPGLQAGLAWIWDDGGSRRAFRDQTKAQLDQRMQGARPAGERPVDFEARSTSSGMAYSTVWSSNVEGIDWRVSYDLTASQYGTEFQSWRAAGYRLVDMEAYQTPSGLRYAAIWWASCDGSNWKQVRDMSRQGYQNRVTSESQQGFRVVDFESYQTSAGQRYAAIWERVPSDRGWAVRTDRGLKQFLNYHHDYVDQGMRLLDYEAYDTANGPRYAGVWIENEPRYDFAFRPAVDSVITRYRDSVGVPGISVVVMQDDEVIYRRGFGWADSVQQKEAHSGTIYITASVAKAIGGTIAARLEERGLIDLSRTSRSYLSGMPPEHTHTVEQLLAKTGCVRHYPELRSRGRPDTTRAYSWHLPVAQRVWRDSLLQNPSCTPGTRYHYSTHGYVFVDAILEEVTGKPVADILRDELTSPFGLTSMGPMVSGRWGGFGALGVRPYDLARAYRRHPTKPAWREAVNYENGTWKFFGGGLQTNARDLARFGWLTLDGQIVSASTRDTRLWSRLTNGTVRWTNGNPPTPTALAWVVRGRGPRVTTSSGSRNRRVAEHGGTARGAKSTLRLYRDEGLTIAILSNQRDDLSSAAGTDHTPETLATRIARQVFANPPPP